MGKLETIDQLNYKNVESQGETDIQGLEFIYIKITLICWFVITYISKNQIGI